MVTYKEGKKNSNADVMSRLPQVSAMELISFDSCLSLDEIREAQHNDEALQEIFDVLDNWQTSSEVTSYTTTLRPFLEIKDELYIYEDILYRQTDDDTNLIILPPSLYKQVLQTFHDEPSGGHLGIDRTEQIFKRHFYWPNIRRIIAMYIRQCAICEKFKPSKVNTKAALQPIESHRNLELIEIDFIGPLPLTQQNNRYILSVVDHFSKYAVAYATTRQDSKTVIQCLSKYFSEFGIVERILSDQGRCFISQEFLDFCKAWNIKKNTSTSYHPQTQGLVERYNQTIIQILKRYVSENPTAWDEWLAYATFAYNSTVQRNTGMSPYEVLFGRKPTSSFALLNKCTPTNNSKSDYVKKLHNAMENIQNIVNQKQQATRENAKEQYDKTTAGNNCFKVGDQVMLYNPAINPTDSRKFAPMYMGPYKITDRQGETNFEITPIRDNDSLKTQTVHQNRLKRSFSTISTETTQHKMPQIAEETEKIEEDDEQIFITVEQNIVTDQNTSNENFVDKQSELEVIRAEAKAINNSNTETPATQPTNSQTSVYTNNQTTNAGNKHQTATIRETVENVTEENDHNDENYVPKRKITTPSPKRNPPRKKQRPERYNANESDISSIDIIPTLTNATRMKPKVNYRTPSLKIWQLCMICLFLIVLPFGEAAQVVNKTQNLGKLFGKAHVCGSNGHDTMYIELPDIPDCTWEDPRSKMVENILTTPFFPITFSDSIQAYGCQIEKQSIRTYMGFWGTKSVLQRERVYSNVNPTFCMEVTKEFEKHTLKLVEIGHDLYTNDSLPAAIEKFYWCCQKHYLARYRLIIRKTLIRFNHHNNRIVSSAYNMEGCEGDQQFCTLSTVTVVWHTAINYTCPLKEGNQVLAQCMGNSDLTKFTIVSETGMFAVSGKRQKVKICNFDLYATNEGIYIRIDQANITAAMARKIRYGDYPVRTTSDIPLISFVAHELEDLAYSLYRKSWINICYLTQQRVINIHQMAKNPQQAYLAARMLMRTPNIMAHPAGQFLSAYECDSVETYYCRNTKKCYNSIPIHYKQHLKEFDRFLLPATLDIILLDTEISCDKPIKMFRRSEDKTQIYVWNGSKLQSTELNNTVTIHLIEQVPNITYLQLTASRVVDNAMDNFDILSDLTSSATDILLTLAHVTNLDMTSLDTEMLVHATKSTVNMVHNVVSSVIDSVYPFIQWLHKLFVLTILTITVIIIVVVTIRIRNLMKERKSKARLATVLKSMDKVLTEQSQDKMEINELV